MFARIRWTIVLVTAVGALMLGVVVLPARGDATSARAESAAVRKGKALFAKVWKRGGKSCASCHASGRNRMTATRLKSYPKYDKAWKRVITGQQKLNYMIKHKGGGVPLTLGSADINALEAYISRLR